MAIPYDPALDPPSSSRHASLLPREHGTYVQLLVPLAAALLATAPTAASALLVIAACAAFFATEGVVIARGGRGRRRQAIDGARAARRARFLGTFAAGAGCAGLVLAPQSAIELTGLVALPAALAMVLAVRRSAHTLRGELIVAIALAGASAPVIAASGVTRGDALAWWAAWSAGFAGAVVAVRGVLERHRSKREREARTDAHVVVYVLAGMLAIAIPLTAVALPLLFASFAISQISPATNRLRLVGVVLAVASVISAVVAIVLV